MSELQNDFNDCVMDVVQQVGEEISQLACNEVDFVDMMVDVLPDFMYKAYDQNTVERWEELAPMTKQAMLRIAVRNW